MIYLTGLKKYLFIITLGVLLGTGFGFSGTVSAQLATPDLVFVFTGESNAVGIASNSAALFSELAPTQVVQILNNATFMFEDLDIGTNNNMDSLGITCCNTHGFELQLANLVREKSFPNNSRVYLVKTGHGGSTLGSWDSGGVFWTKFLQRTNAAKTLLPTPKQWIVWYSLGINDYVSNTSPSTFKTLTMAHLNKIKAELPGAIIVMTQFQSMGDIYTTTFEDIARTESNVYVVNSTYAPLQDPYHWGYTGFKILAKRMVKITNDALGMPSPTPGPNVPPSIVTQDLPVGYVNSVYSASVIATDMNKKDILMAQIIGLPNRIKVTQCSQTTTEVRNLNCSVSGTPLRSGTFPILITVTDFANNSVSKIVNLIIAKK